MVLNLCKVKTLVGVFVAAMISLDLFCAAAISVTNSQQPATVPARSMLTMGGIVSSGEAKVSPLFAGKELPQPPQQKAVWTAPVSNIPTNYVSAANLLFEQGLADPRGCEYREIEIGTGNVWSGDGGVARTHGWVLPVSNGSRFGICWNGLVYPLVAVGTNVDLALDVAAMVTNGTTSWRSALPEAAIVSVQTLQPIRGCLLLRLGRADLAKSCWLAVSKGVPNRNSTPQDKGDLGEDDPYLSWASDWAWTLFDRMICAHMRGDEALAIADARLLSIARPHIEAACGRHGFKAEPNYVSQSRDRNQAYLNFLEQLPQIFADLERREKEGPHIFAVHTLTNIIDQAERIKTLVYDLNLVQARQWGQPGGVNLAEDPVITALINEGDTAVEPLLDCLEVDERLTRSVWFGRDFHRGRTVLPVKQAAMVALRTILYANFSDATEMRAFWAKYKGMKIEERWYAILKDDSATNRWQEAARNIVEPQNIRRFPGGFSTEAPAPTNHALPLRGDCLRERRNPSVSELLTRHALRVPTNNFGSYDLAGCCQMAEFLAQWDERAAVPVARTLSRRIDTVMKYSREQLGGFLTHLSLYRARGGDPEAFKEYADWILTMRPEQFAQSSLECLEPLRKFPTNIELRAVGDRLFAQTNSMWGILPWKGGFGVPTIDSELVAMPAYRTLLCRELQKTRDCGTITLERPGYVAYQLSELHGGGSFGVTLPDSSIATNGTTATIRWCDWILLALANGKHVSPFDPFAPPNQRDIAIQEATSRLRRDTGP